LIVRSTEEVIEKRIASVVGEIVEAEAENEAPLKRVFNENLRLEIKAKQETSLLEPED
jgi:hypothetical protein